MVKLLGLKKGRPAGSIGVASDARATGSLEGAHASNIEAWAVEKPPEALLGRKTCRSKEETYFLYHLLVIIMYAKVIMLLGYFGALCWCLEILSLHFAVAESFLPTK